MTPKLILHYAPDNASLCVRLALEAMGQTYETVLVDRSLQAQKTPDYLALNPNGLIPVLQTPQGPMFETGAIILWLADTYGGLMPAPGAPARARAFQWLFWLSNTLHPTLRMLFYPDQFGGTPRDLTHIRLIAQLDLLDSADHTPWLDGDAPSAQGCYLAPMLRWPALYGGDTDWYALQRWPRLHAFAQAFEQTPAALAAATVEGLGPTPFSQPHPCTPPEGTAT